MRYAEIPVTRILPSPHNPRHELQGITELAASIRAVGVLEPLIVAICKFDETKVELVAGNRRLAGAKLAGLTKVPVLALPAVGERAERTISLVENLHRRDMTHIEQGEAFVALMRTGLSQIEVARQTGVSDYTVSTKVTLVTKLIPEFQEQVHRGVMTMAVALQMSRLPATAQRERLVNAPTRNPSKVEAHRRSQAESNLMSALRLYRDGALDLALADAQRAVAALLSEQHKAAREPRALHAV